MALTISQSHPTFALKDKVNSVSQNFLRAHGFNYFQYLRCFADGSIGLLTNHTGLFEHFQQKNNSPVVFSSFAEDNANTHSYWFLWDEELPAKPVELAREKFNIRHGITLVRRTKHYYDMIAVAVPNQLANPGGFYLNKLKAIEQFVSEFDRMKDLTQLLNKHPIALPAPCRDANYQQLCLTKGKVRVNGKSGFTHITAQELACLRLLSRGESYKQIAQLLEVSPRTVETYLQRVRQRTGFVSLQELERMLLICP
jgi:DNA-binding CsgD family transcriptional regulator